ncbi:arginase family protein, partial [Dactylosporangium sp. NPDC048998]|uniref:arginase family protein n=1 Tax=Dactylosporangium sp. NPDC048998 TaxID=3363976 RepID=UPI00371FD614
MRRIAVVDAPSNLGLRPPTATSVPGCAKAPGALRDHNLLARLGARDAGCITPPRYDPAGWQPGDGVAQAAEIAVFVRRLADRIGSILSSGDFPLVLGGDCSILLGAGLAMRRYQPELGGRIGLVYVDGHSDFRHEGNASYVGAAAGEALALATGRGQANLSSIEQRRPYFRDVDVVLLGIRTHDEYRLDLQAAGIVARPVPELRSDGAARSAQWARDQLRDCAGFWVHIDVDVLDPAVMPAVDAPDVGGIAYRELEILLSALICDPRCVGAQVTVFDPDYDPDGQYAAEVADVLVAGLEPLITSAALVAASPDPVISAPPFAAPVSAPPVSAPPLATPRTPISSPTTAASSLPDSLRAHVPVGSPDISDESEMFGLMGSESGGSELPEWGASAAGDAVHGSGAEDAAEAWEAGPVG